MQPGRPQRKEIIRRSLIYSFMSVSVVVTVTLLMLAVLGYSFNTKDQRLEQGGLLQFATIPSGAKVTVDKMPLSTRTPTKATADATSHAVTMSLDGYRTWQKSISLKPAMIGWLSYTRLIPVNLKAEKVKTLPTLAGVLPSQDRKWFALVTDAAKPEISIADLQNDKVAFRSVTLPPMSFTAPAVGKTQSFQLVSWSENGQRLLVKHTYDDMKTEWLSVDREDATKTENITAGLGIAASKIVFAGRDGRTAFALTEGALRRLNLNEKTISRPLMVGVEDFSVYDADMALYTTLPDPAIKQRTVGYVREDMKTSQQLGAYADDGQPVKIAMSEYFGKRYIATSHGASVHITTGELPRQDNRGSQKTVASFTTTATIQRLSMSSNGRFVIAETTDSYTVNDLELMKTYATKLKNVTGTMRPLKWLDPFMSWYDAGGMLRLYEFDGMNQQDTIAVAEGYDVALSPNNKYLYTIGHDGSGLSLQRVRMIIDN